LTLILTGKTQDEEDSAQNFPLFFVFLKRKPYICTVHFDKSKTETDNIMRGRFAQNLSISYQNPSSIMKETSMKLLKDFKYDFV